MTTPREQARAELADAVMHPPCIVTGGPESCAPGVADRKHPECVLNAALDPSNRSKVLGAMGMEQVGWLWKQQFDPDDVLLPMDRVPHKPMPALYAEAAAEGDEG